MSGHHILACIQPSQVQAINWDALFMAQSSWAPQKMSSISKGDSVHPMDFESFVQLT